MSHYVIVLPDGTEVGFYGDGDPSPELMALLPQVVAAVAALTPGQLRAIRNRRRAELVDEHHHQVRGGLPGRRW